MSNVLQNYFGAFWKLDQRYKKFWILIALSLCAVGILQFLVPENCPKDASGKLQPEIGWQRTYGCKAMDAGYAISWAIFISSLIQIFTGVSEIWSQTEEETAFGNLFGLNPNQSGNDANRIAIVIPKFPMDAMDEVLREILEDRQLNILEERDTKKLAGRLAKRILNADLAESVGTNAQNPIEEQEARPEEKAIKRLSEVRKAILAEADVKAVASIIDLLGKKRFHSTDIILDDDMLKRENNYTTIFVIGLFSNSYLAQLLKDLKLGNPENNNCFTLQNNNRASSRYFELRTFDSERNHQINRGFQRFDKDHESLIAKMHYKDTSIIIVGGISAPGTTGVADYLKSNWSELYKKLNLEITGRNGAEKKKAREAKRTGESYNFSKLEIEDVNFAIVTKEGDSRETSFKENFCFSEKSNLGKLKS